MKIILHTGGLDKQSKRNETKNNKKKEQNNKFNKKTDKLSYLLQMDILYIVVKWNTFFAAVKKYPHNILLWNTHR